MRDEENMTFDNFIVYDNNRTAYERALMVAECLRVDCRNPLYIWGGSGLGKTHLLKAVKNRILENNPGKTVLYITCENLIKLSCEYVCNKAPAIRERLNSADVLLIDNLQLMVEKETVLVDFFNSFVRYGNKGNQIVLACDRSPDDLTDDRRVSSMIRLGKISHIEMPDPFARRQYLLRKINESENYRLNDEVVNYLCDKELRSFREIDCAANIISECYGFENLDVDLELVKSLINPIMFLRTRKPVISDSIISEVAKYYKVTRESITDPVCKDRISYPQIAAFSICLDLLGAAYTLSNQIFKTEMNAGEIKNIVKENAEFQSDIERIKKMIRIWQLRAS